MAKKKSGSKLGIVLAVISAIPAILSVVGAIKAMQQDKE